MPGTDFDVIVVGASVAGATAAAELAASGRSVLLLDRAVFPRDKPCGEGLMPAGAAVLEERGLLPALLERGAQPFAAIRFRCGARALDAPFPAGARGLCVRRTVLDELLARRAAATPGVTLREGFRVTAALREAGKVYGVAGHPVEHPAEEAQYRAPVTLACDGLRSLFHATCGFRRTLLPRRRWGVVGHVRGYFEPVVQIIFFDGGQAFIAPSGRDEATAALLLEERTVARFAGRADDAYCETLQRLAIVHGVPQLAGPVQTIGPLGFTLDSVWRPGLLLVGDSAGFYDPITGEGMTAAILGARAAAAAVREAFRRGEFEGEPFRVYAAAREALLRDIVRLTGFLLRVAGRTWAVERALAALARRTVLVEKMMSVAAGRARWRDLSWGERLFLRVGL